MSLSAPSPDALHAPTPAAAQAVARATVSSSQLALAGLGFVLLAVLIYQTGPRELMQHLVVLGWWAPIIFVPYAVSSAFDAAGWRATFVRFRPALWLLYLARLVGEAMNSLTPTAYLGGEPVKAFVLQRFGVPLTEGATSVILAKTTLTIAQIAFVIVGVAMFLIRRHTDDLTALPTLAALIAAGAGMASLLVLVQRRGLVAFVARTVRRLFPRAGLVGRLAARAPEIDERLRAFYAARPRAAAASVGLHFVGWVTGATEVFAIMALIGHPVTIGDAVVIEALAQPTRLAGILIPGTLGVQEAGGMVIFGLLGLPPELGLAMMLIKRIRELGFNVLGLGLLTRLRPHAVAA